MTKVLITGGCGYIGKHIVSAFLKNGYEVVVSDISTNLFSSVEIKNIDILNECDNRNLYSLLGNPDLIVHLAWSDGFNHNSSNHLISLPKHYLFLTNMIEAGCHNISVLGSMHEVGYHEGIITNDTPCKPLSLYGISKNALRQSLLSYCDKNRDVSLKWLRAYYITGDDEQNNSVFSKILKADSQGIRTFPLNSGLAKYDFLDINDLSAQIFYAATQSEINGIINVCSGIPVSLKHKIEKFISDHNLKIKPEYGVYPPRKYDSPEIYGDNTLIQKIIKMKNCK